MLGSRGDLEHKLEVALQRIKTLNKLLSASQDEVRELKAKPKRKPATKKKK